MIAGGRTLVLGIGNVLMGDEGLGVEVVRALEASGVPDGVDCLDGGTGGFHLLGPMQEAGRIVLVDAAAEDGEPGTVRRLKPRFAADYPRTLTAHDIGLKDLLDAFHLLGESPDVTLFAISIPVPPSLGLGLSPDLSARVPAIVDTIRAEIGGA